MLWTENDAENTSQWNGYPLQIGRFRKDKAMPALISGENLQPLLPHHNGETKHSMG